MNENSVKLSASGRFKGGLNVRCLGRSSGFSVDLRPARVDTMAHEITKNVFGPVVDELVEAYHRSPMSMEELMQDLVGYERAHVPRLKDPVYHMVLETVRQDFAGLKVVPYTFEKVVELPDFPRQKSAGLPYIQQGIRKKIDAINNGALADIKKLWIGAGQGKCVHFPDACLFARSQIAKKPKTKIRATWGFPLSVYMEEARFFYPLQEKLVARAHKFPIAYGYEMATGGMYAIHEMLTRRENAVYSMTDWRQFDKTIPPWLIRDAFRILEELIDFEQVVGLDGVPIKVRAADQRARWQAMVKYFINTPIRNNRGLRFRVDGGVPSGSCWTNILDSIINALVTRYCVYHNTGALPEEEMYLGDDGILVTKGLDLVAIASIALQCFGLELNTEKSYSTQLTENVHFLGYYDYGGVPWKPQDMLIAQFVMPERKRKDYLETATAALGQMLAGFDGHYASKWYEVITAIAERETRAPFTLDDIVEKVRVEKSRFKFLRILGIDSPRISLPTPHGGFVVGVEPPYPSRMIDTRCYDLTEIKAKIS
uniref:RdRp n=1 Tax=Hubei partiti-like virus 7 TaxID=1923070 RepID=A0A1L3KLD8_9VIRU|nr:RdRp [Hubei partiti-like virus 7]